LGVLAALLLAAGLCWGYPLRDGAAGGPVALLLAGGCCAVLATALWVLAETAPAGLRLDGELAARRRLPAPAAWGPLLGAALALAAGAALVGSLAVGALALVLALLAAGDAARVRRDARSGDGRLRRAVRDARRVRAFVDAHGGGAADGQAESVGRDTARLIVVTGDGWFGDVVTTSVPAAQRAAALAGVTLHEALPAEVVARIRTGRYEWRRMAGIQVGGR
jgi:hypothetical protein